MRPRCATRPYTRSTGVPRANAAEITPAEPDPGRTGEGRSVMRENTVVGHRPRFRSGCGRSAASTTRCSGAASASACSSSSPAPFLVPALSLRQALLAILVGGIFGNALLGLAALIGAEARVPAMVLLRAPLGRTGSLLPTALNVAPEPRLDDLRGARHRHRGAGARRTGRSGSGSSRPRAAATRSRCSARSASCAYG